MLLLNCSIIIDKDETTNNQYLMNIENGTIYNINDMAFIILNYINNRKTIDEYIDYIYQITDKEVSKDIIRRDAEKYIQELITLGIVYED